MVFCYGSLSRLRHMDILQFVFFIHMDIWWIFPGFGYYKYSCWEQLCIRLAWHLLSFLLVKNLGVDWPGVVLLFKKTAKLFSQVIILFYFPTSNIWAFSFLHTSSGGLKSELLLLRWSTQRCGGIPQFCNAPGGGCPQHCAAFSLLLLMFLNEKLFCVCEFSFHKDVGRH